MSPSQNCAPRPRRAARSKTMSVSGRASPGGGTTAWRNWTSDCASGLISKPILSASRSKQEATGSTTSASSAVGVMNRSAVGVELQRRERLAPWPPSACASSMLEPKPIRPRIGYGLLLQNGAIEIAGGDVAGLRRPERALAEAQRRRHALRRGQVLAGDRPRREAPETARCRRRVEAAGQRVEQRHGARRLRGVGVLLVAAPGVVGNRARVPDQPRGLLDLSAWDPADRLDLLRADSAGTAARRVRRPDGRPRRRRAWRRGIRPRARDLRSCRRMASADQVRCPRRRCGCPRHPA